MSLNAQNLTFGRCWSNYLGRQPQLQLAHTNTKKFDVFPSEESELWSPFTDAGIVHANAQPARTRAVALQISKLAEISSDLLISFYQPSLLEKPLTKQAELKKLSDIHTRLEAWKRDLPPELEPKEGQLPSVLVMHMFFQLLYIHLYRPFLRYTKSTSPLPAHVSPRKFCTQAASSISKILRLYKRTHGLRQIINKVVYIAHSACTIHLLNLPEKNAKRDIIHGIKQLEEMGECWTAARRTLYILNLCAEKWKIELPEEAQAAFTRTRVRWGSVEPGTGPASPDILASMSQQMSSDPVPDLMAQNMQHQAPLQRHISEAFTGIHPHAQFAISSAMAPSPSYTDDTRRSSGNFSMPPHSAAELSRSVGRMRPSTTLTKEQQDAWNALQARMASHGTQRPGSSNAPPSANASSMFGGVASLIEESQDWWYKDQNQLAVGFDNWNAPTPEWSMNGANAGLSDIGNLPTIGPNGFFTSPRGTSSSYQPGLTQTTNGPTRQPVNGNGTEQQQRMQQQQYMTYSNNPKLKRQMQFEDEVFYS